MENLDLHHIVQLGLFLLMIAAGITAIAKKFDKPYPIALVIVGAIIGLSNIAVLEPLKDFITEGEIFNFVIITLFLPALLGEAALKLPFSHLNANRAPILTLAFGGTFLSFLVVGFLSLWLLDFPIAAAFVFAAVMSATDPVSVLSIFKGLGVNKKLSTIIEGESLFNDGLAVVLFNISAFSLVAYMDMGLGGVGMGLWDFIKVVSLGIVIGSVFGLGFSRLTRYFDDYPLEIIFSIILFYGSFLLAESAGASGVIAVVVGALVFGNYGAKIGMSPTTKLNINNFWDVAALLANSLVFLMVGLEIARINVHEKWGLIFLAIAIVLVARSAAVYLSMAFIRDIPIGWKHVLNWGGLRGSLSIALVLSLPRDFPAREDILLVAFSVVLFSLLIQGLSIKTLLGRLGITQKREGYTEYEKVIADSHQYEAAIEEIQRVKDNLFVTRAVSQEVVDGYKEKLAALHSESDKLLEQYPELKQEQQVVLKKYALYAQYDAIESLQKSDVISADIADQEKDVITKKLVELEDDE
ncbi:Na(+)/H(+) antiporter NhaG [Lentibacillus sp. JNUCC-1]|uniref:cation:proton antiporter n=1 Tax=Lentibacillus sp. JNUCC-1 TaxID=2654513 RepID=UPI0012E81216|nr:cation:proton antiporter [Lentibacillus sp. JNUCC-1]MUV37680.1 Na(+)/H(+) antiporter NhaG [Lentibacillus sp. JNUCC-1]